MPVDRHALVTRHNIETRDAKALLALGNGEFCFGVDGTGLQTFTGNCMSHWGWHSFPLPAGWTADRVPATGTFQRGRCVGPDRFAPEMNEIKHWMFDNPHVMNLGRLRLQRDDAHPIGSEDLHGVTRQLDLWRGLYTTRYTLDGHAVVVTTCVHPTLDLVATRIECGRTLAKSLRVVLDFAYPAVENGAWVGDFDRVDAHATDIHLRNGARADIMRRADATTYHVGFACGEGGEIRADDRPHAVVLRANGVDAITFVCAFSESTLPGNGGVLYAVAMMAAGWDGAPHANAPGFPDDGSWTAQWEGLKPAI